MKLDYTIKRSSRRRKLTITVERDRSVVVHAPTNTSEETIKRVVNSKRNWIYEKIHHKQKIKDLPHPPGKELVNGESALYLGRRYRIEIRDDVPEGVQFDHGFVLSSSLVQGGKGVLYDWYFQRARDKILPRVKFHAHQLGAKYNEAKIVDNRFRWGSCTVKDNINLNWRLIKAPMFVINYVIVHELAHLLEPNHTSRFWNIIQAQIPNVDKAKTWLRDNGDLLEEEV